MLYLPFTPCSRAPLAELADERVGDLARPFAPVAAGSRVRPPESLSNCGIAKWFRFTRQVESSMISPTGTRCAG